MTLFLIFVSLTVVLRAHTILAESNKSTIQGSFEGTDGSKCVWFEIRPKATETVLTTACHCRSRDGDMQTFSCQYEGDLSKCSAYKADSRLLYETITSKIAREYGNGCGADKVTVPECEGVELTKVDRMKQKSPCYTEDREEL